MKISYAITVHNETAELEKLLRVIYKHKQDEDEIVILHDDTNSENDPLVDAVYYWLDGNKERFEYEFYKHKLNDDFATHKNYLNSLCKGEYIFQLDADEVPQYYLISNIKAILEQNPEIDLYWVPRINIVKGLTDEWTQKWHWRIIHNNEYDQDFINWPDWQGRIYKNKERISWIGKVHEVIVGADQQTYLPKEAQFALVHIKELERQIKQNEHYTKIIDQNG